MRRATDFSPADNQLLDRSCEMQRVVFQPWLNPTSESGAPMPGALPPQRVTGPDWETFPQDAQYFDFPGVIATPALGTNDAVALTFQVPPGWDGVIRLQSWNYTGAGFVQGSGDLTFRVRKGGQFVKNYDSILTEFGTPQQPRITRILIEENQLIEYLVSVAAAAVIPVAGTFINVYSAGWFWPRR